VIQHIRSYTILEVVSLDELQFYSFKGKTHEFIYVDIYGVEEHFMFVLHFSLAGDDDSVLNPIFRKCEKWYKNVLAWEDENTEL
jgi:hypothetical protein